MERNCGQGEPVVLHPSHLPLGTLIGLPAPPGLSLRQPTAQRPLPAMPPALAYPEPGAAEQADCQGLPGVKSVNLGFIPFSPGWTNEASETQSFLVGQIFKHC